MIANTSEMIYRKFEGFSFFFENAIFLTKMPCKPLCRKSKIEFFNHENRSIHFIKNSLYQSLHEIKRAIQSCLFELVFTCETNNKARKVEIRFFHVLSIFYRVNTRANCTIGKSLKICLKWDLQVGSQNGFIESFFGVKAIWDPNFDQNEIVSKSRSLKKSPPKKSACFTVRHSIKFLKYMMWSTVVRYKKFWWDVHSTFDRPTAWFISWVWWTEISILSITNFHLHGLKLVNLTNKYNKIPFPIYTAFVKHSLDPEYTWT